MNYPQTPAGMIKFYASIIFGSLVMLISAATLTQLNTNQNLDNRTKATAANPNAQIRVVVEPDAPQAGSEVRFVLQINTDTTQISGIEIKNLVLTGTQNIPDPTLTPASISQFATVSNQVTKTDAKTATFQLVNILSNPITPFTTNDAWQTFATIKLTPSAVGTLTLTFDATQTLVTEYRGDATNILNPLPSVTTVNLAAAGTNPTPTPTPTPTSTPTPDSAGNSCTLPSVPQNVKARGGENPGEIRVSWLASDKVDHYAVSFGKESKQYQWGSANIGNVREFIIKLLEPGTKYFIVVSAANDCGGSAYSSEVSAISSGTKPNPATAGTGTKTKPEIVVISPITNQPSPTPEMTTYQDPTPIPESKTASEPVLAGIFKKPFLIIMALVLLGGLIAAFLAGGKRTKVVTPETKEANITPAEIEQLKSEPPKEA